MKALTWISVLLIAAGLFGCSASFAIRDTDGYRKDTRALLAAKSGAIKDCYDEQLKIDQQVSGKVVIKFNVQEETGAIVDAKVDEKKSTAPQALSQCVLDAISKLKLDPPDKYQGQATFIWEFGVKS